MKKKIVKLICFLLIFFLIDRGLSSFLMHRFEKFRSAGVGGAINKARKSKADILIFGSSRAVHHFDPEILGKKTGLTAYNAGRDGNGIPFFRALSEIVLRDYTPKIVIFQLEAINLTKDVQSRHEKRLMNMAPYMDHYTFIKDAIFYGKPENRIKFLADSFRFNSSLLYFLFDVIKKDSHKSGYLPINKKMNKENLDDLAEKTDIFDFELSHQALKSLIESIKLASSKGSIVYVVTTPRWHRNYKYPDGDLELANRIKNIAMENNVKYINISTSDYPVFRNEDLFADPGHLNKEGASLLTEILSDIIINDLRSE